MTKYLFLLSGECLPLAKAEVERALETIGQLKENKLLLDLETEKLPELELGYSKEASKILFSAKELEFLIAAKSFNWLSLIKGSYYIDFEKGVLDKETRDDLLTTIWQSLKKPEVDIKNAKYKLKIYSDGEEFLMTSQIWINTENFEERKAHNRLYNHPTALHPKLARAMINLAGPASKNKLIADPFCGAGGLLIEGALMNRKMLGSDIDEAQVLRAKENLKELSLKSELEVLDALEFCREVDSIVTDLPYGKNSKALNLDNTLKFFFEHIGNCTSILVIGSERSMNLISLMTKKWVIIGDYSIYIHKNMTKKIYLLESI